jgi:hypothetical protein
MRNPFAALMRAEDRMFAARGRRRARPMRLIVTTVVSSVIFLALGSVVWLFDGFRNARTPLLLGAVWMIWAGCLSIVRLTVRGRRRG